MSREAQPTLGSGQRLGPGEAPVPEAPHAARQFWADVVRIAAVILIFLFHFTPDWLATNDTKPGATADFVATHFAPWAIAAFVVLSAFALALTLSTHGGVQRHGYRAYLSRRFTRIIAPYWTIAVPFALAGFALGEAAWRNLWKLPIWLLGLGFFSPTTYQPISEAWWYVSLALQISLLMPLLMAMRRKVGLVPLGVLAVGANLVVLACVGVAGERWRYLAQGLVFSRLAELVLGIAAAELALGGRRERRRPAAALAVVVFVMVVSPLLDLVGMWTSWQATIALGVIFTAGALLFGRHEARARWLSWAATISYCFYLSHAPVSKYAGRLVAKLGLHVTAIALPLILVVCVLVAWAADRFASCYVAPRISRVLDRLLAGAQAAAPQAGDSPSVGNTI